MKSENCFKFGDYFLVLINVSKNRFVIEDFEMKIVNIVINMNWKFIIMIVCKLEVYFREICLNCIVIENRVLIYIFY